jgi:hypothetical protein
MIRVRKELKLVQSAIRKGNDLGMRLNERKASYGHIECGTVGQKACKIGVSKCLKPSSVLQFFILMSKQKGD